MAALHSVDTRDVARAGGEVDIAGSRWPVYKLEALAAGLVVASMALLVLGSAQVGVLLGAGVGAALWTMGWWRAPR